MADHVEACSDQACLAFVLDVPPVIAELGPQGLACLAASSKSFQQSVEIIIARSGSLAMLESAVDTSRASIYTVGKHMQAVRWLGALLLRKAPATAQDVTRLLLNLPAVPRAVAEQLVSAGMRITYAQLLEAADSMVASGHQDMAGVKVWFQAQQQLGVQTDIPAGAVIVCCSYDREDITGTICNGDFADLLQLAMNCSRQVARVAAVLASANPTAATLLEPGAARKLLLTAARRPQGNPMHYILRSGHLEQHLDAATLEAMLKQHLACSEGQHDAYMRLLCRLPAAAQLSTHALADLLLVACSSKSLSSAHRLCQLPAAQQLSSETVLQLLHAALKHGAGQAELVRLPAAAGISSSAVLGLMRAALARGLVPLQTCSLPAAAGIGSATLLELLHAAVGKGSCSSVGALCAIPAVAQLSSEAAYALPNAAVEGGSPKINRALSAGLPRLLLKRISSQQMAQLLAAAQEQRSDECSAALRRLQTQLDGGGVPDDDDADEDDDDVGDNGDADDVDSDVDDGADC